MMQIMSLHIHDARDPGSSAIGAIDACNAVIRCPNDTLIY
jgi:hypothetical protein